MFASQRFWLATALCTRRKVQSDKYTVFVRQYKEMKNYEQISLLIKTSQRTEISQKISEKSAKNLRKVQGHSPAQARDGDL